MKKLIPILAILMVVVFAAGCTAQPQTFNSNGITFQYPGDWNTINSTSVQQAFGSSTTVITALGKDGAGIIVYKTNLDLPVSEITNVFKSLGSSDGNTLVSETTRTIDGVNASVIVDKNTNGTYYTNVAFQKNNNIYLITISSPNSDQQTVDTILNSFKVQ